MGDKRQFGPEDRVNPNHNCCTVCNKDKHNNIFFVPRAPGFPGRCILDEMTFEDVHRALATIPRAKQDLLRITDDPELVEMAKESRLVQSEHDDSKAATDMINKRGTLPFYTVFKGNRDGTIF